MVTYISVYCCAEGNELMNYVLVSHTCLGTCAHVCNWSRSLSENIAVPVCAFTYKREHKPPKAERCIPASNIVSAILIIEKRDTGGITGLDRLTTTEHFISRKKIWILSLLDYQLQEVSVWLKVCPQLWSRVYHELFNCVLLASSR